MSGNSGPKIVNSGCVLALDAAFSDSYPGSGTAWNDLSGNGYSASFASSPTYSNVLPSSLTPANGNTLSSTYTQIGPNNITMSIWFKWSGVNQQSVICYLGDAGASAYGLGFFIGTGLNSVGTGNKVGILYGGSTYNALSTSATLTSAWTNLVITRDGTTSTLYQNNVFIGNTTSTPLGSGVSLSYYCSSNGNSESIILLYNRSLSASEVSQNFNALRGRFGV